MLSAPCPRAPPLPENENTRLPAPLPARGLIVCISMPAGEEDGQPNYVDHDPIRPYKKGEKEAPLPTYFICGKEWGPSLDQTSGFQEVAKNIFFLGAQGIKDLHGLRVAFLSGHFPLQAMGTLETMQSKQLIGMHDANSKFGGAAERQATNDCPHIDSPLTQAPWTCSSRRSGPLLYAPCFRAARRPTCGASRCVRSGRPLPPPSPRHSRHATTLQGASVPSTSGPHT